MITVLFRAIKSLLSSASPLASSLSLFTPPPPILLVLLFLWRALITISRRYTCSCQISLKIQLFLPNYSSQSLTLFLPPSLFLNLTVGLNKKPLFIVDCCSRCSQISDSLSNLLEKFCESTKEKGTKKAYFWLCCDNRKNDLFREFISITIPGTVRDYNFMPSLFSLPRGRLHNSFSLQTILFLFLDSHSS